MKKVCQLFLIVSCVCSSQNKQLLYGFNEVPQALLINPGTQVENDWYVGIPLLSHLHANVGMSGLSAYDVFAKDGRDFNSKLRDVVYSMDDKDVFAINQQLEILSGGFAFGNGYEKNEYLSFGLYEELDVFSYFPKDYAVLAYEGNFNNINRTFDLSDLNVSGEFISVLHVGYNKKVSKRFTMGARGKIYSSIVNVNSTGNRGTFVTVPGRDNFYKHIFNLGLELRTSGLASLTNDENSDVGSDISTLKRRILFGGNLGLGFDVGFTYKLKDNLTIDGSIQDIGFIRHKKDIENHKLDGYYEFEGINPLFPESSQGQTAQEYWDEVAEQYENLFEVEKTKDKYTTWRPVKLNAAINYAYGSNSSKEDCDCMANDDAYGNAVGVQLFAVNRPKQPQLALTAFYYKRLFNQLRIKATYTLDSYSSTNLGLGISAHMGNVNFYVMADNLLKFQNLAKAQSLSLQLGFNYIIKTNEKQ